MKAPAIMVGAFAFSPGTPLLVSDVLMTMTSKVKILGCALLLSAPVLAQAPATHPAVEVIKATTVDPSVLKARKGSYSFKVATGDWTDTGVVVAPGDHLNFTATGNLTMGDGKTVPPDGVARGWKDLMRIYPLN